MKPAIKKRLYGLGIVLAILSFLFIAFFLILWYMFSSLKDEDYKQFCSNHIPLLTTYYQINNEYPKNFSNLNRLELNPKYLNEDCGYRREKLGYYFIISYGMGVAGYDSIKKEWWYD
jgi:hypothetical protein